MIGLSEIAARCSVPYGAQYFLQLGSVACLARCSQGGPNQQKNQGGLLTLLLMDSMNQLSC